MLKLSDADLALLRLSALKEASDRIGVGLTHPLALERAEEMLAWCLRDREVTDDAG